MSWSDLADTGTMTSFPTSTIGAAGRPGTTDLREALGPGFAMVAPTEATLQAATGHAVIRSGRPSRH